MWLSWLVMPLTSRADADLQFFASPSEIVTKLLGRKPRVVAFGEYHQTEGGSRVPSSVKRFGDEMLAAVAPYEETKVSFTYKSK